MKVNWRHAVLSAVVAFSGAGVAAAQTPSYSISDGSVRYASSSYMQDEEEAEVAAEEAPVYYRVVPAATEGDDAFKLFSITDPTGRELNVGGHLSAGITLADHNVASNAPVAFNNPIGQLLGNQAWIYAERVADGSGGLDWGFRADYVFGADGPDTQSFGDFGWDFGWNTNANYGSAIPQLYGELALNDFSLKVGHFYTIIGYEVVPATGNFFYSHAYTMNYGEPFTHTGALLSHQLSDNVTTYAGYTFGWDSGFENFLDAHTFLGGISLQLTDNMSLAYMANTGSFGDGTGKGGAAGNIGNIYVQSIVATMGLGERMEYVFQTDYGTNTGAGGPSNQWYGANQYLFYTLNDKWKAGARYEIFRDDAGLPAGTAGSGRVGNGNETYTAATMGLNWTPHSNVTVRPELRFDWVDNGTAVFGGNNSLMTFGVDAILTY